MKHILKNVDFYLDIANDIDFWIENKLNTKIHLNSCMFFFYVR